MAKQAHQIGWASTKPGRTKYHFYQATGESLCNYHRQPGELHFAMPRDLQPRQFCEACNSHRYSALRLQLLLAEVTKQYDPRAFEDAYRLVKDEVLAANLPAFSTLDQNFYYVGVGPAPRGTGYWLHEPVGNFLDVETAKRFARRFFEATKGTVPRGYLDPIACCRVTLIDGKPPGKRDVVLELPEQEGGPKHGA
ncbi:hypothetical protein [Hymenobacter convexus]|uniref:hypothetical protein n=1 Tax=Hymenobacter sp. CA1UV-4 TaxID=3063782 RepID=UPI002713971C|nr:hypothetical protein [Hymenobacter sp. CA1UV-4]MDO7853176.1 hypothetical protein [Hymenobacter sp. CA1UV-4]